MDMRKYLTFKLHFLLIFLIVATTDPIYSTRLTTGRIPLITIITRAGDMTVGLFNTTAGKSTGGKNGRFASNNELPAQAIDNSVSTKYLNFGATGDFYVTVNAPGVGTGYYATPAISSASVAIGLCFATANDVPDRDPTGVTLERTNSNALDDGSSWSLIYNVSIGISSTISPGRATFVAQQNFSTYWLYLIELTITDCFSLKRFCTNQNHVHYNKRFRMKLERRSMT